MARGTLIQDQFPGPNKLRAETEFGLRNLRVERFFVAVLQTMASCTCPVFRPTLEEFSMGFEKYIEIIEPQVRPHGICKIVPPKGWWDAPDYEALIQASKKTDIPYPVRQCISGARGNYTLTLLERPPESLASFRIKANNTAAQKLPQDLLFADFQGNEI